MEFGFQIFRNRPQRRRRRNARAEDEKLVGTGAGC